MGRTARLLQGFVICMLLLAPAAGFLLAGVAAPYEGRSQTEFPAATEVARPDPVAREQLADALLERSTIRQWALGARARLLLTTLGYVDEPEVVSGADGYLFLRSSLEAWRCEQHARLTSQIERFIAIVELADAADAPIRFVIHPNKASVMPEMLQGRAGIYRRCYVTLQRQLESRLGELNSPRVLYQKHLLGDRHSGTETFLRTDTHWNSFGSMVAFQELLASLAVRTNVQAAGLQQELETDLRRMAQLPGTETDARYRLTGVPRPAAEMLILHDSFFQGLADPVRNRVPGATLWPWTRSSSVPLTDESTLVVSTAERFLLGRVSRASGFGWGSPVADWLFDRSAAAAADCSWQAPDGVLHDGRFTFVDMPEHDGPVCLDVAVATPRLLRAFLPDDNGRFSNPDSIVRNRAQALRIVLPTKYAGRTLRLNLESGDAIRSLRVGYHQ